MKRIISVITIVLWTCVSALAQGQEQNGAKSGETDTTVTVVTDSSSTASAHLEETVDCDADTHSSSDKLPFIALAVAILGLVVGTCAILFSRSKYSELRGRYHKLKEDQKEMEYGFNEKLNGRYNSSQARTDAKMEEWKQQIYEYVQALTKQNEVDRASIENVQETTEVVRFTPKSFYGVFKPKYNGVPADQVSDVKEDNATIEIVTDSDSTAYVHLVSSVGKTQFANLNDLAVDVVDGNPQAYDFISEVEAGRMKLEGEVWRIVKKIKVKLS